MQELVWDKLGDRHYETGVDKGVIYLPNGSAIPWNGLTSVEEEVDNETVPVYFDGRKTGDIVVLGDFSATLRALTYPEEFLELEGFKETRYGSYLDNQSPKTFGLSYRTKVGNDLEGIDFGYKIHLVYNVTAVPTSKEYSTISDSPEPTEFEWDITAVPDEFVGARPTAHVVFDSRELDPWLLGYIENILYGSTYSAPSLPPLNELMSFVIAWFRYKIVDNGDGTFTATSSNFDAIQFSTVQEGFVKLVDVGATFINEDLFELSDLYDIKDVLRMRITDNGDGTWTATGSDSDISIDSEQRFEIENANAVFTSPTTYNISSAVADS